MLENPEEASGCWEQPALRALARAGSGQELPQHMFWGLLGEAQADGQGGILNGATCLF